MRFGVCTSIDQAGLLADLGFDYVEVHAGSLGAMEEAEFAAFCQTNAAAPIHAEAANCLFPGEIRLTGPDVDPDTLRAYARKVMSRLGQAGIRVVSFGSGGSRSVPEGFSRETAWQQLIEAGRILAQEAAEAGVVVGLEPLRPAESNIINTLAEGMQLVQQVNHPNFRLLCDYFHVAQGGGNPGDAALCGTLLAHLHMAKVDDRGCMYPGDGFDYMPFWQALRTAGYDGRISFEGTCTDFTSGLPGVLAVLKQSQEV